MQQAKKDAAKNWRATLSGGGAQMKNEMERGEVEGDHREREGVALGENRNREQYPVTGAEVQERARKDR